MNSSLKQKLVLFFLITVFLVVPGFAGAQDNNNSRVENQIKNTNNQVNIYFFYSKTCPHCHDEALFLTQLKKDYKDKIQVLAYEVTENRSNGELLRKFGQVYGADVAGVPMTFIGERYVVGYYNDEYTGVEIKNLVDQCLNLKCSDIGNQILSSVKKDELEKKNGTLPKADKKVIKLPLIGAVDLKALSLPLLTVILGTLDGFNPCSMWALIMLITLLLNAGSRRKLWLVGLSFILASSLSYFLFLTAWLNGFLLFGYLTIIRLAVGLLAIGVGIYFLNDYYKKRKQDTLTCDVTSVETKSKMVKQLGKILSEKKILAIILGVAVLAFSVNLIEFMCSAGFPAIYTQVLSQNNLPKISYYLYILVYVFFYMLDDIIVLLVAGFTWKLLAGTNKYSKYAHLIGGALILILGILMLVKPGWLTF